MQALLIIIVASFIISVEPCQAQPPTRHEESPAEARPQDSDGPAPAADASSSPLTVSAGYELHRDHLRYTFENPSNIDTQALVPHTFTQSYIANNQWLVVAARYPLGGDRMDTEFGFTPERQTPGSDLDTFYDPNDDVIVSGTAGDVLMRSLRFVHWSEGRVWGLPWRVGYAYRRDHSRFLPADRVLTHSNPPSEVRSPTFGHETTVSQMHEIPIDVAKPWTLSPEWKLIVGADISPLIWARLTTILPDKYPGQEIVFDAKAIGGGGRIQLLREAGWPIVLTLHYGRTWSYNASRQFSRDALQASIAIAFRNE